jgi:hypothetical protein
MLDDGCRATRPPAARAWEMSLEESGAAGQAGRKTTPGAGLRAPGPHGAPKARP